MSQRRCMNCMSITSNYICEHCGMPSSRQNQSHQLPVGTVLHGQYQVGRVLGQGGFGITYLGWDSYLDIPVAVKEFYPRHIVSRDCGVDRSIRCYMDGAESSLNYGKERFLREAKALAKLDSEPAIVRIRNYFPENDTAYIIMEYVPGVSLQNYVSRKGGRLTMEETLRILRPIMEALETVHKTGMIHRDISPDNIMLRQKGSAKLLDFGAVRSVEDPQAGKPLSKPTEAIVKQGFAPIEQYQSQGSLGPWTDVYALCATIYYCTTGTIPVDAPSRMLDRKEVDWGMIPGITKKQKQALRKGMEPQAADRTASVAALMRSLYPSSGGYDDSDSISGWEIPEKDPLIEDQGSENGEQWSGENSIQTERNPWLRQEMERWDTANGRNRSSGAPEKDHRQTGYWVQKDGGSYHYGADGTVDTGWKDISANRYYFGSDGQMRVGWRYISGDQFYFGEDGIMRTGWQHISGETYYFGEDGAMRTGTQRIGGSVYEFRADGTLIR